MHDSPTVRPQQHFSPDSFSYRGSYLGTNFGRVHVGCHCWGPLLGAIAGVPLLGAIAGVPLLGAIAGVPLLGAMLGCHCWVFRRRCLGAIAGCHCLGVPLLGAMAGVPLLDASYQLRRGSRCWLPLLT